MCNVAEMLRLAKDPNQREVMQMVLEDEDGYGNEFAATVLSRASRAHVTLTSEEVKDHRRKKCPCHKKVI